jgi:hypothetical protein
MARAGGPHTRHSMPGRVYRGSKGRVARLSPFDELPANFWMIIAIGLFMLGLSAVLIYQAM